MKRKLFSSFVLITSALVICSVSAFTQTQDESAIFQLVNRERSRTHLGELMWDERLAKVARDYSRRMAREGFFDHYDSNGKTVTDRASRIRGWSRIGENLFVCDPHASYPTTAIRGWMKSPTHRTNILEPSWTATGVGIAVARDGSIFITQVFTSD